MSTSSHFLPPLVPKRQLGQESGIPPLKRNPTKMKYDELMVRKWMEANPKAAEAIALQVLDHQKLMPRVSTTEKEQVIEKLVIPHESVFDIARLVYSSLDLEHVLQSVLSIAVDLISAERCSVFLVDKEKNELYTKAFDVQGDAGLTKDGDPKMLAEASRNASIAPNPGIRIPMGFGVAGSVAQSRQGLNIKDAYADARFNPEVDKKTGFQTHCILCMPIFGPVDKNGTPELVGVASLVNKEQSAGNEGARTGFTEEDASLFQNLLVLVGIAIRNAQLYESSRLAERTSKKMASRNGELYERARQETERGKLMLRLAQTLYCESNTKDLVTKIVGFAKELLGADKASLFLVDAEKDQLYSTVFDSGSEAKMTIPMNKGLMGAAASTGKSLNIPDAYLDTRFNPEVDIKTNYRTVSILLVPILDQTGKVVGVANLINKVNPETKQICAFDSKDEDLFHSFGIFCGLALHKTMMLEDIEKQKNQLALTMEIMSFHATVKPEDVVNFKMIEDSHKIQLNELRHWTFDAHRFSNTDDHLSVVVNQMFHDLAYGNKYDIGADTLISYILTVRRNYRPVPYHNFTHATSVTHCLYYFIVNGILDDYFDSIEMFSMFIAALNHDIDHRGTNNSFQKNAHTVLASFYSTSVMERHHFNHAMTILTCNQNMNILSKLSNTQYRRCLQLIEHAILATDLGLFFSNKGKALELIKQGTFNKQNLVHRDLLRGIIMTCCDLSAMFKPWENAKATAEVVYEEFFLQGDEEIKRGLPLSGELMNRANTPEIPRMQYDFYNFVVFPAYEILHGFLGEKVDHLLTSVRENGAKWKELKDSGVKYEGIKHA